MSVVIAIYCLMSASIPDCVQLNVIFQGPPIIRECEREMAEAATPFLRKNYERMAFKCEGDGDAI